jgi:NADPH-dependent curcumin reductase CurA
MGAEATGIVVETGANVKEFKVGDAVMVIGGGYSEYFTFPARRAIPVPKPTPEMVALGVSGLTAGIALEECVRLAHGQTVLVTAAAGGTGSFAVQIAKLAGCRVIGTCSSADKVDYLRSIGCDRPVNYKEEKLSDVLKAEYPKGIDIVFESVGGKMFDTCVNALAARGDLITIGAISEYEGEPEMVTSPRIYYKLLRKSASLHGFWLMHYLHLLPRYAESMIAAVNEGRLLASVDPTEFRGVESAVEAIEYLYAGKNTGKVVVRFV